MQYKRFLILTVVGIILSQCYTPMARGAPPTHLSIVYTNDVMGEVEPCG